MNQLINEISTAQNMFMAWWHSPSLEFRTGENLNSTLELWSQINNAKLYQDKSLCQKAAAWDGKGEIISTTNQHCEQTTA